ncbi:MAG TPA: pantoate--beta-alanine ligase [Gammaproteobacteria bacterium]|nr:pantoate--beta-alanine ligase [Gammaproteobacteria bacterium]
MQVLTTIAETRRQVRAWRARGERVAFVPTMGNLHRGHLALVEQAEGLAERVVVSVFVNPLQFGEGEDFDAYPRTLERDRQAIEALGVDLLFAPNESEIYPHGREGVTRVEVPGISDQLCGAFRPGHFTGVATVVAKLFHAVEPDVAVFGEKDYQQLVVIRRMVAELDLPVEVVAGPTVREADGLALSSRNAYLTDAERATAPRLYAVLQEAGEKLAAGAPDVESLEREAAQSLAAAGFEPEYFSVRRATDLAPPGPADTGLVVLAAARLGRARLIDNLRVSRPPRRD